MAAGRPARRTDRAGSGPARGAGAGAGAELDGRLARSERSREAIVEAMLQLVGEGELAPTAEQVAARADVGIRTVFRHFRDMEGLFAAMDARLQAEVAPRFADAAPRASLDVRARELVQRRVRLFDAIAPYKRAERHKRPGSAFLRERHAALVRRLRSELRIWLPELEGAPAELADALELALSFEAWDRLRSEQRLGGARALAAIERTVLALLAGLRG